MKSGFLKTDFQFTKMKYNSQRFNVRSVHGVIEQQHHRHCTTTNRESATSQSMITNNVTIILPYNYRPN